MTVFLYKMIFPFHARRMEGDKRMKLIFTVVVIAGKLDTIVLFI